MFCAKLTEFLCEVLGEWVVTELGPHHELGAVRKVEAQFNTRIKMPNHRAKKYDLLIDGSLDGNYFPMQSFTIPPTLGQPSTGVGAPRQKLPR
jgi:hypothetical protein